MLYPEIHRTDVMENIENTFSQTYAKKVQIKQFLIYKNKGWLTWYIWQRVPILVVLVVMQCCIDKTHNWYLTFIWLHISYISKMSPVEVHVWHYGCRLSQNFPRFIRAKKFARKKKAYWNCNIWEHMLRLRLLINTYMCMLQIAEVHLVYTKTETTNMHSTNIQKVEWAHLCFP